MELIRLAFFASTVLLAIVVGLRPDDRRRANLFIAWMLTGALGAALLQRDLWPFTPYPFLAEVVEGDPRVTKIEFMAVDETGVERAIGSAAWEPFSEFEIGRVIEQRSALWSEDETRELARGLLERARSHHVRMSGFPSRFLETIDAPEPVAESRRPLGPSEPVALRIYETSWYPRARLRDRSAPERRLLIEVTAH